MIPQSTIITLLKVVRQLQYLKTVNVISDIKNLFRNKKLKISSINKDFRRIKKFDKA